MQRDELIQITAATADFPMDCVEKIVDTLFDIITVTLQTQDWVELRTDFGSFVARNKGGDIDGRSLSKTQRVISFKSTPSMKKKMRQDDQSFLEALNRNGLHIQINRLSDTETVIQKSDDI